MTKPAGHPRLYEDCDPLGYEVLLSDDERGQLWKLRQYLDARVRPLLADHWERGAFPEEVIRQMADLDLISPAALGERPRSLYEGFRNFELCRTDASIATWYNGQSGLFRTTVMKGGSDEQVRRWLPAIDSFAMTGVFALTEPDHGSDIARGMETTASRTASGWVLSGTKRWIGNAPFAEYLAIVARTEPEPGVGIFLVRADLPGVSVTTMGPKMSLRMVQNAEIVLESVSVPDEMRLAGIREFKDVAALLRSMRSGVAWFATGVQAGAYRAALDYVTRREQFGRPLAGFQLVQEKLVRILGNLVASLGMVVRLSQQEDGDVFRDQDSALAKAWITSRMRESAALAREVVGGNGILIDNDVARFFADAEAIYTYEGTMDINTLIVGRAITGQSAFVR